MPGVFPAAPTWQTKVLWAERRRLVDPLPYFAFSHTSTLTCPRGSRPLAPQAKKRPLDVGAAFGRLRRKAEGGDPDAQALMGFIFLHGMNQVLSVDPRTYGVTASTRHASALLGEDIGPRLFDTRFVAIPFVPVNRAQGLNWYERAAYQGHRDAQASLAKAHLGQQTAYLGYRWALVLAKSPWPKDYVSVDGNTAASVEQSRARLEKETEADLKAEARSQADAFKPTPEVSQPTK